MNNSLSDPTKIAFTLISQNDETAIGHAKIYLTNGSGYLESDKVPPA